MPEVSTLPQFSEMRKPSPLSEQLDGPNLRAPNYGRTKLLINVSLLIGVGSFLVVLLGVIMVPGLKAYRFGPGILSGFIGGVISFFVHLTGMALITWLAFIAIAASLAVPFSLVGAFRGRCRWYMTPVFITAGIAIPIASQFLISLLGVLGGVSRWDEAAVSGSVTAVTVLMLATGPAFIRDLWRWCNGASLGQLAAEGPISSAWVMVPILAMQLGQLGCMMQLLGLAIIATLLGGLCGRFS